MDGEIFVIILNEKKYSGPVICDEEGYAIVSGMMNAELWKNSGKVQMTRVDIIKLEVDVEVTYSIHSFFKRGFQSSAREEGVSVPYIDLINRWRNVDNAGGRSIGGSMWDYYTGICLI